MKIGDEVFIGEACEHGARSYVRQREDGSVESGIVGDVGSSSPESATGVATFERVNGCRYRVKEAIRYNARGSTGAVSDAYRSGWDAVFGAPRSKKSREYRPS